MPLYDYRCQACGAEEEHIQKFSDPPLTKCSSCNGALDKLISGAAFHLKGGGWYKDGYASTKPGGDGKPATESKPAESKPAATGGGGEKKKAESSSGSTKPKAANE